MVNLSFLTLNPTDFEIECSRYKAEKQYRDNMRKRGGCAGARSWKEAEGMVRNCLAEEWTLLCRGGQFSPAKFRAAFVVLIEETRRREAGLSW